MRSRELNWFHLMFLAGHSSFFSLLQTEFKFSANGRISAM